MKQFTWAERIDKAERRGRFTLMDARLAKEWTSCAVGEQHLPKSLLLGATWYGTLRAAPNDVQLGQWGIYVSWAVKAQKVAKARLLLKKIERRSVFLMRREAARSQRSSHDHRV